jgi:hypothetical protein
MKQRWFSLGVSYTYNFSYRERAKEKARKEGKALDSPPPVKKSRQEAISMVNLDADDPVDDSDSDSGDSDDDTAMLMAELQKIKSEKAMEEAEKVRIGSIYKKKLNGLVFLYFIQHCFTCRPLGSTVSEDVRIEPRTDAAVALTFRRSNHSARYHPFFICVPDP